MKRAMAILLCLIILMPIVVVSATEGEDSRWIGGGRIQSSSKPKRKKLKTHVTIHYHFASLVGEWWKKPNQYFYFKDVSIVVLDGHLIHVREGYTLIIYCGPGIDVWVLI